MADSIIYKDDTIAGSEVAKDVSINNPFPVQLQGDSPTGSAAEPIYVSVSNPSYTNHAPINQESNTNETNATKNRYYDVSNYDTLTVDFDKTGGTDSVTFTVERSCQDDGTAGSGANYRNITISGTPVDGTTAASSYTATVSLNFDVKGVKFVNLKTVSAGGANDADYRLDARGAGY